MVLKAIGMGILGVGAAAAVIWSIADEHKRKNSVVDYSEGISEEEFEIIAISAAKPIKRLWVTVDSPIVYGTVQSESGISTWKFTLDFNDYGHITGNYWKNTENEDSSIPDKLGEEIKRVIRLRL